MPLSSVIERTYGFLSPASALGIKRGGLSTLFLPYYLTVATNQCYTTANIWPRYYMWLTGNFLHLSSAVRLGGYSWPLRNREGPQIYLCNRPRPRAFLWWRIEICVSGLAWWRCKFVCLSLHWVECCQVNNAAKNTLMPWRILLKGRWFTTTHDGIKTVLKLPDR